jgi:hypothetical protein
MGLDYRIALYFPAAGLEDALLAAAAMAAPGGGPIRIELPSGRWLSLPSTHDFRTGDCHLRAGGKGLCLDTVLRFPNDGVLGPYAELHRGDLDPRHIGSVVEIGYIYLWVHVGRRFVELSFAAATSSMSLLFLESSSIHRQFLDLLQRAGGIAAVIDVETDEFHLLSDPSTKIQIDRRAYLDDDFNPETRQSDYDVDGFASALLTACQASSGDMKAGEAIPTNDVMDETRQILEDEQGP